MAKIRAEYPRAVRRLDRKKQTPTRWWAVWTAWFAGVGIGLLLAAAWRAAQLEP